MFRRLLDRIKFWLDVEAGEAADWAAKCAGRPE